MRISDWSSDVWSSDLAGAVSRIQTCAQLEDALEGVDYVQESLPEIVELKKEIFGRLDRLSPPAAVLASSTSSIPASAFTEHLPGRHRCLVAHPVNPPYLDRKSTRLNSSH